MKILRKADRKEVKRAFVLTWYLRDSGISRRSLRMPTEKQYVAALKKAKHAVSTLTEEELDERLVVKKDIWNKRRLKAFDTYTWSVGILNTDEVGVWRKAGGLPRVWTKGTLQDTANLVREAIKTKDPLVSRRTHAGKAIPSIIRLVKIMKNDKYLFPIAFQSGTGTRGRNWLPKTKYDLDDGNMRSIAYAVVGEKKIKAYIGIPKNK